LIPFLEMPAENEYVLSSYILARQSIGYLQIVQEKVGGLERSVNLCSSSYEMSSKEIVAGARSFDHVDYVIVFG
jgi:hypothetical protein